MPYDREESQTLILFNYEDEEVMLYTTQRQVLHSIRDHFQSVLSANLGHIEVEYSKDQQDLSWKVHLPMACFEGELEGVKSAAKVNRLVKRDKLEAAEAAKAYDFS